MRSYHDDEWGHPAADEARIYENLCLEGFQAGLSWLTVLRKREGFRAAFSNFDPEKVARYTDAHVERLLADTRIIRNRAKINATVTNARATLALRETGTSLAVVVWQHRPAREHAPGAFPDLPATTPESDALSKELRRRGFAFLGPTTVYASMQSLGVVNDHLRHCHWRAVVETERARFVVPA
ncbi:MAG: DNA-3-methyladenine glycosylase I [Candidatus Dormibacteraeota bacterium]|nr:DNA-3-methyladenine glycosylase I [Candidatus Dormibacteraeota bacterium]